MKKDKKATSKYAEEERRRHKKRQTRSTIPLGWMSQYPLPKEYSIIQNNGIIQTKNLVLFFGNSKQKRKGVMGYFMFTRYSITIDTDIQDIDIPGA